MKMRGFSFVDTHTHTHTILGGTCRARNTFSSALLPGDEDAEIYTDLSARKGHIAGEERSDQSYIAEL